MRMLNIHEDHQDVVLEVPEGDLVDSDILGTSLIRYFPEKSGKIWQKPGLVVYHDVIYHFSYSNHGKFIFGTQCAIWRIFSKCLEDFPT